MKIATFKLYDRIYHNEEYYGDFWILAGLLTDDVSWHNISFYKNFLKDTKYSDVCGNYSSIEKEGKDVLIACQFDRDFEPHIRMSQQEMLSILDQWEALIKLQPKEIIIFKRGDSYILEGRNASAKE